MPDHPIQVSLLALPDTLMWPVSGLFEVFSAFPGISAFSDAVPEDPPFAVEIVAVERTFVCTSSGLPFAAHRTLAETPRTAIVIVPSMSVEGGIWHTGRNGPVVEWLRHMHASGAMLCSACSGVLLLAETGLLDGCDATLHYAFAPTFRRNFPTVRLRVEQALVVAGTRKEFVMSGGTATWQDLVLYLVSRHVGPTAAQALANYLLLQWHAEGQGPYVTFSAPRDHGDAAILLLQDWLSHHYTVPGPVEEMEAVSAMSRRTLKRRFTKATGLTPLRYVQHLRIEEAKRRLERTNAPIDEISWAVGYEEPAFFRRLFKRLTTVSPGTYRRKFRVPAL